MNKILISRVLKCIVYWTLMAFSNQVFLFEKILLGMIFGEPNNICRRRVDLKLDKLRAV